MDNGIEYGGVRFINFYTHNGTDIETSIPYTPEQDGVIECIIGLVSEMAHCILLSSQLLKLF